MRSLAIPDADLNPVKSGIVAPLISIVKESSLPSIRTAAAAARAGKVHDGAGELGLGSLVLRYGSEILLQATPVIIPEEENFSLR